MDASCEDEINVKRSGLKREKRGGNTERLRVGIQRRMWKGGDRGIWTVTEWKEERGRRWGWTDSEMESRRGREVAVKWELLSAAWFISPRQSGGHFFFLGYLGTWQVEPALNQEQLKSLGEWTEEPSRHYTGIDLLLKKLHWLQSCCCRARRDGCDTVWLTIFAVQLTWLVVWDKPCYTTFTV